jgi:uncharacterized protein
MHEKGSGVTWDEAEAVRLYRRAAEGGDADAMANLALMYEDGRGVANEVEAVRLYRLAADAGSTDAMVNLDSMYEEGLGVEPDPAEARKWYGKAAELGDEDAREALKELQ